MKRGPRQVLLVLLAAASPILGLAACGSGAGSTSSATGSTATTTSTPPSAGKAGKAGGESSRPSRSSTPNRPKPGASGGSVAKGGAAPFRTHGGDNSIQEYGGEAGGSELDQAAAALHGYLDSRAAGQWARACSYMAGGLAKSLQQLGGGAQSAPGGKGGKPKHPGCPQLIAAMSAGMPAYLMHDLTQARVGALRVEGDRAFLLYHGAHHTDYFMPMAKEAGRWKVAAISASALS